MQKYVSVVFMGRCFRAATAACSAAVAVVAHEMLHLFAGRRSGCRRFGGQKRVALLQRKELKQAFETHTASTTSTCSAGRGRGRAGFAGARFGRVIDGWERVATD